ncbi:uncharacterized protein C16C10.8 [Eurosta solidaginis]|uniref:uncharacterized protein C16C10.8 n=1 Tax=Eurosta solidaginis TaxID=178769 RepID=UPI0035314475
MVFFTCNHCGDSVKKAAVEKHYNTKCRGATESVSCMDCLQDFYGKNYVAHTKCITELQKYSGKDYVPKEARNRNVKKQESWMDIIRAILDSNEYKLSGLARSAFERLQNFENVPRKKAKFQNFAQKCVHMPMRLSAEVWSVLEKELEKMKMTYQQEKTSAKINEIENQHQNGVKRETNEANGQNEPANKKSKKENKAEKSNPFKVADNSEENIEIATKKSKKKKVAVEGKEAAVTETNGNNGEDGKKIKKHKDKKDAGGTFELSTTDTTLEGNAEGDNAFEWSAVLEKIVRKNAEGVALEKLKKRVLKKYTAKLGADELTEKQLKKFEKKFEKSLKKSPGVQMVGGIVKAC